MSSRRSRSARAAAPRLCRQRPQERPHPQQPPQRPQQRPQQPRQQPPQQPPQQHLQQPPQQHPKPTPSHPSPAVPRSCCVRSSSPPSPSCPPRFRRRLEPSPRRPRPSTNSPASTGTPSTRRSTPKRAQTSRSFSPTHRRATCRSICPQRGSSSRVSRSSFAAAPTFGTR